MKNKKYSANGIATTTDLIELFILEEMARLKAENKRYKEDIKKAGKWTEVKHIDNWKPFDFYHYFCKKYYEKYSKEYKPFGRVVKVYKKIEAFISCNNINNEDFKEFIDIMFKKYFNNVILPTAAHLCSNTLYTRMIGTRVKYTRAEDLLSLDQQIISESKKFEDEIAESNDLSHLDLEENK